MPYISEHPIFKNFPGGGLAPTPFYLWHGSYANCALYNGTWKISATYIGIYMYMPWKFWEFLTILQMLGISPDNLNKWTLHAHAQSLHKCENLQPYNYSDHKLP